MMDHVKRVVLLLVLVIIATAVVRTASVPESFGKYGHYRADSVGEIMNLSMEFADSQTCGSEECHPSAYNIWIDGGHKTVNCETCHGPAAAHSEDTSIPVESNISRAFCAKCHHKMPARPEHFRQVNTSEHAADFKWCVECHNPHKPWFY
jgi:hypothetical protein